MLIWACTYAGTSSRSTAWKITTSPTMFSSSLILVLVCHTLLVCHTINNLTRASFIACSLSSLCDQKWIAALGHTHTFPCCPVCCLLSVVCCLLKLQIGVATACNPMLVRMILWRGYSTKLPHHSNHNFIRYNISPYMAQHTTQTWYNISSAFTSLQCLSSREYDVTVIRLFSIWA